MDVSQLYSKVNWAAFLTYEMKRLHVVCREQGGEQRDICRGGELILGGIMGGHVYNGVDVGLFADDQPICKTRPEGLILTKGTPAKFQKMTRKPHFSWNISQV